MLFMFLRYGKPILINACKELEELNLNSNEFLSSRLPKGQNISGGKIKRGNGVNHLLEMIYRYLLWESFPTDVKGVRHVEAIKGKSDGMDKIGHPNMLPCLTIQSHFVRKVGDVAHRFPLSEILIS